jgi:hypothetical protein
LDPLPQSARRIEVFFYGLFMDVEMLRAKGLHPANPRLAHVQGMGLRIGNRATLIASRAEVAYGFVIELTHAEIERLYSEDSVRMYRPEAVTVQLVDGSSVAALCFNLPAAPDPKEANPKYAASLRELGRKLGLPGYYLERLG